VNIFDLLHCIAFEILNTVIWWLVHCSVLNPHEMVGSSSYLVACCLLVPEYFYPDGQYNHRCSYDDCVWNISVDTDRICATPILVPHKNQKLLVTYSSNMLKSNYMSWANHCHLICCRGNTAHYLLHGCHHKHPMDGLRLVFPPAAAAILCFPVNNLPRVTYKGMGIYCWQISDFHNTNV